MPGSTAGTLFGCIYSLVCSGVQGRICCVQFYASEMVLGLCAAVTLPRYFCSSPLLTAGCPQAANMLLRRFVGNRLATDGQNIQHPYVWMLFFFALSFTQLLEGLIFGLLRLLWLLLLNLCSALRLDKAIYPVLKATDMGYQAYMGNALFEVAANNFSAMPTVSFSTLASYPVYHPGPGAVGEAGRRISADQHSASDAPEVGGSGGGATSFSISTADFLRRSGGSLFKGASDSAHR